MLNPFEFEVELKTVIKLYRGDLTDFFARVVAELSCNFVLRPKISGRNQTHFHLVAESRFRHTIHLGK